MYPFVTWLTLIATLLIVDAGEAVPFSCLGVPYLCIIGLISGLLWGVVESRELTHIRIHEGVLMGSSFVWLVITIADLFLHGLSYSGIVDKEEYILTSCVAILGGGLIGSLCAIVDDRIAQVTSVQEAHYAEEDSDNDNILVLGYAPSGTAKTSHLRYVAISIAFTATVLLIMVRLLSMT